MGPVGRAVLFLGAALLAPACGDDDGGTAADAAAAMDAAASDMDSGAADAASTDAAPVEEQTLFPPYGAPPEELSRLV